MTGLLDPHDFIEQFADPRLLGWSEPALTKRGERRREAEKQAEITRWEARRTEANAFNEALLEHLAWWSTAGRPEGTDLRWVMSPEWWLDVRSLTTKDGHPLMGSRSYWMTINEYRAEEPALYGRPVDVRDDGGVPHLEPISA